jgi:hypothetical protein
VRYLDPEEVDAEGILDARGKKVWELVVCDATLSLQEKRQAAARTREQAC